MMVEIVDPHVHHWQLSANKWYPMLVETPEMSPIAHDYLPADYQTDSTGYHVSAVVHVSATTEPRAYLDEARWLEAMAEATGWPAASIGTIDPDTPWETVEADLAVQAKSPLFRGIRVLYGLDANSALAHRLVRRLASDGRVFDLVTHPGEVPGHLRLLDDVPELVVAVEHAAWPESADAEHFQAWQRSLGELASRPNVYCKISGLAMTLHSFAVEVQRPWIESCIETFGVERCMVASNFPVDRMFGSYDELFTTYRTVAEQLSTEEQAQLFAGTARNVYGLSWAV